MNFDLSPGVKRRISEKSRKNRNKVARKWRKNNLEATAIIDRRFYLKNREELLEYQNQYNKDHPEQRKSYFDKISMELKDPYVKKRIIEELGIDNKDITDSMIALKRKQLEMFRTQYPLKKEIKE